MWAKTSRIGLGEWLRTQQVSRRTRIIILVVIVAVLILVSLAVAKKPPFCHAYSGLTCRQSQEINQSLQEEGFNNERSTSE